MSFNTTEGATVGDKNGQLFDEDHASIPIKRLKLSVPSASDDSMSPTDFLNDFLLPRLEDTKDTSLYDWMLENNLLKTPQMCDYNDCRCSELVLIDASESTKEPLWECKQCRHRKDIREGSFFGNSPLNIRDVIRTILAWLEGHTMYTVRGNFNTYECKDTWKRGYRYVTRVYAQCADVLERYMKKEGLRNLVLGGSASVVLVDLWPHHHGQIKRPYKQDARCYSSRINVLWMTDTNYIPPRYFAHILPPMKLQYEIVQEIQKKKNSLVGREPANSVSNDLACIEIRDKMAKDYDEKEICGVGKGNSSECLENSSSSQDKQHYQREQRVLKEIPMQRNRKARTSSQERIAKEEQENEIKEMRREEITNAVLPLVLQYVAPNSLIAANDQSIPNICSALRACGKYEAVVPISNLLSVDDGLKPASSVLSNIWKNASRKCADIGTKPRSVVIPIVNRFLWRQMFGSDISTSALPFLKQIGSFYVPKAKPSN